MSTLKIAHLNIRSLVPKLVDLKDYISNNPYDIFCISESWLNANILDSTLEINGYKLFRQDRPLQRGGGICIFAKIDLQLSRINNLNNQLTEQLWLSLTVNKINYAIGVVYRPPEQHINEFLGEFEDCLGQIVPLFNNVVCCGDFNIDYLQANSGLTKKFQDSIQSFGLSQVVNKPTRFSKTTTTLLDLFVCSDSVSVSDCMVHCDLNIPTDHCLVDIKVILDVKVETDTIITKRCLSNIDEFSFNTDLYSTKFWNILYLDDINTKLACFNDLLLNLFNKHAPIKTFKPNKRKACPWLTENSRLMMRLRDRSLLKYKRTKTPNHWE